jgi:hypothetical protein
MQTLHLFAVTPIVVGSMQAHAFRGGFGHGFFGHGFGFGRGLGWGWGYPYWGGYGGCGC